MPIMKRFLPLLLLGWMSACINVPEIESSPPMAGNTPDAGPGPGTPDSGTQPSDLAVKITEPVDTLYTNTSVSILVEVSGGVADTVQLLKNGDWLATLSAPFRYTWNTTAEAERSYTLTAQATRAGKSFVSAPVTVVVDRTNLQVASRTPAHGSTNVDYSTPIQVVFTKAVKASTISDTTVSFAVAGVLAEKTLSLSSDGKTLTVKPKVRPTLPASFSVGLSRGITDLASNALVVPSTPWSFDVPDWYAFGGPLHALGGSNTLLKDPTSVLDKQGNPIIAWSEQNAEGRFSIFVYHWDGKAFVPMGGALNATSTGSAVKPTMALDGNDKPVVAWQESDGFNENIYVKRWTGSTWQTVGTGALSAVNSSYSPPNPTPARNPSLAIHDDIIYVAWDEFEDDDAISAIYVWKSVAGTPFIAAGHYSGIVSAVSRFSSGSKPSLVVDTAGLPIVAFQEQTLEQHNPTNIYVMRLQPNGEWVYAVPPFYGNDVDGFVSGGLSASAGDTHARDSSLTIDAHGNLYLSWVEESNFDGPRDIQVFRSTGPQSWTRMGAPLSAYSGYSYAHQPKIKTSPTGNIFITWKEYDLIAETGYHHLFACRWNNNAWLLLTLDTGLNQKPENSISPTLSIDMLDRPVITWFESSSSTEGATGNFLYIQRHNN